MEYNRETYIENIMEHYGLDAEDREALEIMPDEMLWRLYGKPVANIPGKAFYEATTEEAEESAIDFIDYALTWTTTLSSYSHPWYADDNHLTEEEREHEALKEATKRAHNRLWHDSGYAYADRWLEGPGYADEATIHSEKLHRVLRDEAVRTLRRKWQTVKA